MSESLGDAVLKLRTDDADFKKGVRSAKGEAEQLDKSLGKASAGSKKLGASMETAGAGAGRFGEDLTKLKNIVRGMYVRIVALTLTVGALRESMKSVVAASDFQEMENLLKVTFGKATDDVNAWAEKTADAVGRSRVELLKFAGDFATFLKPLGVAAEQVAPMSEALGQLVVDISSFRNLSEEEVMTRLFSGLAGETEAVRRLGIDIGQTALQNELLAEGIKHSVAEATQAEKVQARYAIILRQTADAQGDAARTGQGFANASRQLQSHLKDLERAIGSLLLPSVETFINEMNAWAKSKEGQQALADIAETAKQLAPLLVALTKVGVASWLGEITVELKVLNKVLEAGTGLQRFLAWLVRASEKTAQGTGDAITKALKFDPATVQGIQNLNEAIRKTEEGKLEAIKRQTEAIKAQIDVLRKAHRDRLEQIAAEADAIEHTYETVTELMAAQAEAAQATLDIASQLKGDFTDALIALNGYEQMQQQMLEERIKKIREDYAKAVEDIRRAFRERLFNTIADTFAEILKTGRLNFKRLADTMIDIFAQTLAQMLSMWIAKIAQMKAIGATVNVSGGGTSGAGALSGIAKLFKGVGGNVLTAVGVAAGVLAGIHALKQSKEKKQFNLGAVLNTGGGTLQAIGLGPNSQTGQQIADAMKSLLESIRDSTGILVEGIGQIQIKIRRDKKKFEAVGVGIYDTAEEAIAKAMQNALMTSDLGAQLAPSIRDAIARGNFINPDNLKTAVQLLQQADDAFRGLTDQDIQIRNLGATIQAFGEQLRSTGVSVRDAALAEAKFAVSQFQAAYDQLTGATQTPEQLAASAERRRQLFNAQRLLELARLKAEEAQLEGQAAVAKGEVQLDNARIEARRAFLEGSHKILQQQSQVYSAGLKINATYTNAIAAQLDAIRKVIAAMPPEIKKGQIAIPKLSSSIGHLAKVSSSASSAVDDVQRALQSLWDWRRSLDLGQFAAASPIQQLKLVSLDLQRAFKDAISLKSGASISNFQAIGQQALELAQKYGASGPLFQSIRQQVTDLTDRLLRAGGLTVPHTQEENIQRIADSQEELAKTASAQLDESKKQTDTIERQIEETSVVAHDVRTGLNETYTAVTSGDSAILRQLQLNARKMDQVLTAKRIA